MGTKATRQKLIQKIIAKQEVETQFDLAQELLNHGYNVTQATISRDIKELGLIKVPTKGNSSRYSMIVNTSVGNIVERMKKMFIENATSINHSENIIVVKTLPGTAQGLAACLDQSAWPEIVGTVAGYDTILIVITDKNTVLNVIDRFESLME